MAFLTDAIYERVISRCRYVKILFTKITMYECVCEPFPQTSAERVRCVKNAIIGIIHQKVDDTTTMPTVVCVVHFCSHLKIICSNSPYNTSKTTSAFFFECLRFFRSYVFLCSFYSLLERRNSSCLFIHLKAMFVFAVRFGVLW